MEPKEQMINIINHIYWFYNADMRTDIENQIDFKSSLDALEKLIKDNI